MCVPTEPLPLSDVFFCIVLISYFLSSLPKTCRNQNTDSQQFHLCPSGPSGDHLIQDPTLYTVIQSKLWTVELKVKKLRGDSEHNSVEYVEQMTTLTFCMCELSEAGYTFTRSVPPTPSTLIVTITLWTAGMPPCLCSNPHLLPTARNGKVIGLKAFPSYDTSLRQQQLGNKLLAINAPESGKFTAKAITT